MELRDLFPTALAVADVLTYTGEISSTAKPEDHQHLAKLDGKPVTCLLVDPLGLFPVQVAYLRPFRQGVSVARMA